LSKILKAVALQTAPIVVKSYTVPIPLQQITEVRRSAENDERLKAAQAQESQLVNQAKAEASQLLEKAKQQAAEIKRQADELKQEAVGLQQQARGEGYQVGYQEGYDAGTIQGRNDVDNEKQSTMSTARKEAQQIMELAQQEAKTMIIGAERDIVELALAIARKILAREIEENPLVVLPIVKEALEKVRDQDEVNIRVSPDDFELVVQAKKDLQTTVGRSQALKVTCDETLTIGSCIIETNYGTVDARIESQLENLKLVLRDITP
jgi:flagellar assembly protein FliH